MSQFYTVFAVTDPDARSKGISAFVVERNDEGVSFGAPEKKLGIKGSPTCEVYLDQVRIPESRRIGAEGTGFATAMRTLDHTRVTIAAQAIGIAQGALDYALGYVKERKQFGKAIAEFQGLQFMLADMGMKLEAARQLTYAAAAKSERGDADLTYFGAAAKCFASDVAMEITTDAVQLLGGYGYTKDFPVERMMRDAKITQIYEGTNQIQRVVMARQLLAVPAALSYLAYFSRSEVSPRAMSANIASASVSSHSTAEPAEVEAPGLEIGTVRVRPLPPETLRMARPSGDHLEQRGVLADLDRLGRGVAQVPVAHRVEHRARRGGLLGDRGQHLALPLHPAEITARVGLAHPHVAERVDAAPGSGSPSAGRCGSPGP